jgi:hypothetical protein
MGAGTKKAHAAYTVAPAGTLQDHGAFPRLSDAVDLRDDRPSGSAPLVVDPDGMDAAIRAAGVQVGPETRIRLRLRAQSYAGEQGSAAQVGPGDYRLVVHVAPKDKLEDRHLYVLNNSLIHELRHVRQMQDDPEHGAKYMHQNLTVGYAKNKYELEARRFGRLADHTGEKDTRPAGPALGKKAWGFKPG